MAVNLGNTFRVNTKCRTTESIFVVGEDSILSTIRIFKRKMYVGGRTEEAGRLLKNWFFSKLARLGGSERSARDRVKEIRDFQLS